MENSLLIDPLDGWTRITLNRPEARNALNTETLGRLADALDRLASDPDCRCVVITGAEGNFAAGADIGEIADKGSAEGATDPRKGYWGRIRAFPKPMIAAVDGYCLGGGLELALMADMMVLGQDARLGLPETSLGIIPGAGGSQRLTALVGRARAMRLVLTGEIIDASTAYDWGLAAWLAQGPSAPMAEALVTRIAERAPLALACAKAAVIAASEDALAKGLALERTRFEALLDSADKREGIAAFREKRKPEFRGE